MNRFAKYFFRGLVVLVPVAATIYVFYLLFTTIDQLLPFAVPGVGVLVAVGAVLLIGWLASNIITNRLFGWMDRGLTSLPLVNTVYRAIKEVTTAVLGDSPRFHRPVRVELIPDEEVYMLGFVTRSDLEFLGTADHVSVYLPQAYNIGGQVILVQPDRIEPVEVDHTRVMSFLISGGLAGGEEQ